MLSIPRSASKIGIQFDDFGRIAGLLDDEVDQKRFQFGSIRPGPEEPFCRTVAAFRSPAVRASGCAERRLSDRRAIAARHCRLAAGAAT